MATRGEAHKPLVSCGALRHLALQPSLHIDIRRGLDTASGLEAIGAALKVLNGAVHFDIIGTVDLIAERLLGLIPAGFDGIIMAGSKLGRIARPPSAPDALIGATGEQMGRGACRETG